MREVDRDLQSVIAALTLVPAVALDLAERHGLLASGYVADIVALTPQLEVAAVWADGAQIVSR